MPRRSASAHRLFKVSLQSPSAQLTNIQKDRVLAKTNYSFEKRQKELAKKKKKEEKKQRKLEKQEHSGGEKEDLSGED